MIQETHIGAYGLIENDGKILLSMQEKGPYKGLLGLPGGKFLHGETARQCVARQMEKESDLNIDDLKLFDVLTDRITWQNNDNIEDLHLICILFNIKAKIKELKDKALRWLDLSQINYEKLTPLAIKAITNYKVNS